jgi:hypothetical protein
MEANIDQVLAMVGISLATRLTLCLMSARKKEKILKKRREQAGYTCAVVMPRRSGKTRLCSKLQGSGGKIPSLLVDINEILKDDLDGVVKNEQNHRVVYYPKAKQYIETLKSNFSKHRIIIFSDDFELIQYLDISDVVVYAPRLSLHSSLLENVADKEARRDVELSYVKTIASGMKPIFYFENLETVVEEMRRRYGLTLTI